MNVVPGTEHPKSLLFVPLIIGDKVKSYVSLQNIDMKMLSVNLMYGCLKHWQIA